jgi:hypothetical protein
MFRPTVFVIGYSALFLLAGCGQNRVVTVTAASADAQNFPNGIVQFSAMGISSPTWCIGTTDGRCNGNISAGATVDGNGRAQCLPGATSGTVTVLAGTGGRVTNPDGGMQLAHFGSAQLTCP